VVAEFHASRDAADGAGSWPADFLLTATYELLATTLRLSVHVKNPDRQPLPCGLGLHPYFRLPLGGRSADACVVQLPVSEQWELVDMLPTGKRMALTSASAETYQSGQRFADLQLDHVFGGLRFDGRQCTARITDPDSGLQVSIRFDRAFRECVVFTPPHREAICIEPYTCVPGAADLSGRGIDAGWQLLAPGASFTGCMEIEVRQLGRFTAEDAER
jgi:aldose 1-epimerase